MNNAVKLIKYIKFCISNTAYIVNVFNLSVTDKKENNFTARFFSVSGKKRSAVMFRSSKIRKNATLAEKLFDR